MNNGNARPEDSTNNQTSVASTLLENMNPDQSSVQMTTSNLQQQRTQEGTHVTDMTQHGSQSTTQTNQPSMTDTNLAKNKVEQLVQNNPQNLASGRAGTDLQTSYVPPEQHTPQESPSIQAQQSHPIIQPLLPDESKNDIAVEIVSDQNSKQESPQKTTITKVKISDELNIFDWLRATDIMHQIAEKAKSSVDSVITTLDPGMREYLYSGGSVNIVVISDHQRQVSPIRDSFQDVFGRATVVAARYEPPRTIVDYPIRTACGFVEAIQVASEKIKKLRSDTSSIPQNQVVIVVQPALVQIYNYNQAGAQSNECVQPEWFLTYCMLIDDPVLGVFMKSFSQFIPMDQDVIDSAKISTYPEKFEDQHLGFSVSIDEVMASRLRLSFEEMVGDEQGSKWLPKWAGINETKIIRQVGLTLANSYRRRWNECAHIEPVVS